MSDRLHHNREPRRAPPAPRITKERSQNPANDAQPIRPLTARPPPGCRGAYNDYARNELNRAPAYLSWREGFAAL